jgi:hypothetical protein
MEPAVDGRESELDAMVLFELFLNLGATPAKLVPDVDDLLNDMFWGLAARPAVLGGSLAFDERTYTCKLDTFEPAVDSSPVSVYYLTDLIDM